MKGRVLFISNQVSPTENSGGGSIVIYRHLKRFKDEGHEPVFIHTIKNRAPGAVFEEIGIFKRWWFPPLRQITPFFTNLRTGLYFAFLRKRLQVMKGDVVLGILGDYSNLLALKISKTYKIPLYMIYHDDSLFNRYGKLNIMSSGHVQKLIRHTEHFFAVSEPMKLLLESKGAASCSVLYPIPEGYHGKLKKWEEVDPDKLNFYNSGLLFEDIHLDLLQKIANAAAKINAKLNLIGRLREPFEKNLAGAANLKIWERFNSTDELLNHLSGHADVLLVFYSFKKDLELRMFESFPSKFAEYAHLGLPIMIIAPEDSAIGKWAIENNWSCYINTDDEAVLLEMMSRLRQQDYWLLCRNQSLKIAKDIFEPEELHKQLSKKIFPEKEH